MRITVVTIFPEMFESVLGASLLGKALEAGLVEVDFVNPREFTTDRHRTVDDSPYGGGPGMVMKAEPLISAIEAASGGGADGEGGADAHRILLTPAGAPLGQQRVRELSELEHLVLVCGRYEGVDDRVSTLAIDEEISVGDFVMSGGELAAMALIDAVSRYVPGVLGEATSTVEESFSDGLLEYPQYTRPAELRGLEVPEVLQSGNHARIRSWRREQSLLRTAERRPELFPGVALEGDEDPVARLAARTYVVLAHYPVYDRTGAVVTTSLTNLDLHDIARSAATYGLAGYYVVTPIEVQRTKAVRIVSSWPDRTAREEADEVHEDHRAQALGLVRAVASIEDALREVSAEHRGARPLAVITSAEPARFPNRDPADFDAVRALALRSFSRPLVLFFGTGWGLSEEVEKLADQLLTPLHGRTEFNHLSVRTAVGVILDRLFGLRA